MGPKNACSYADIAMENFDKIAITEGPYKPNNWWRFRDDIFEVWTHGEEALHEYTGFINSIYPTIKFVLRYSKNQLEFLDVNIKLNNGLISTDVYSKPTDGHLYLLTTSAHPKSNLKSIPFSIALRLKRICSDDQILQKKFSEYKGYLIERGYAPDFIQEQFDKANEFSRHELLTSCKRKKKSSKFPLVVDYNPILPKLGDIIRKHLPLLHSSTRLKKLFPDSSIFPAYRRSKSLHDLLKKPKKEEAFRESGCFKCNRVRCDLCHNYLREGSHFTSAVTGKSYPINAKVSCTSVNVVYLATCVKCNVQYVGSTSNQFKVRFRNHKSDMLQGKSRCELAIHFKTNNHSLQDIEFKVIEQITKTSQVESILTKREGYWLAQLQSIHPLGLNKRKEFNSYKRISFLPS